MHGCCKTTQQSLDCAWTLVTKAEAKKRLEVARVGIASLWVEMNMNLKNTV
jgi:hypothetical protein